ncbi:MAG: hypothetical protein SR1Q5_08745 [Quinella sp. 1Q5]|nr:hypothetical protein [Quinella sp. 1Q5]
MATREENIKKINDELEKLSDEELDKVAGGTICETKDDSQYLYDYGLMDNHYGSINVMFHWGSKSAEVDAGWAKAGITCVTKPLGYSQYFLDGKEITRNEARDYLKANFKRLHNISDY